MHPITLPNSHSDGYPEIVARGEQLARSAQLLVSRDAGDRGAGLLRLLTDALRVEAATLVVRLPRKTKHSVVASIGYDRPTVDYLISPDFTDGCPGTRRQLQTEGHLLDWKDVPGHVDTFAVQEVFRPRGFFNGMTLPLHDGDELVGACHVSSSRAHLRYEEKDLLLQFKPALLSVAAAMRERELPALTPREMEILTLVRSGYTNAEIAAALFLSIRTVSTHVEHILSKLNCTTRAAAAAWAATHHAQVDLSDDVPLIA